VGKVVGSVTDWLREVAVVFFSISCYGAWLPVDVPRLGCRAHVIPCRSRRDGIGHAVGDKVEAAYRRGDLFEKRRQLADAWAKFCAQPATAGDNVRPIRAAS
jgi:hypothetical protein